MKRSLAEVNERRETLLALLSDGICCDVKILAEKLSVSEMTIRRDCSALAKMGRIKQSFGKIELIENVDALTQDVDAIEEIKQAIAKEATRFVTEDDTLFINTSSTALLSLTYLKDRPINLLTNNIKVVHIEHNPKSTIFLSGGEVRFQKESLTGEKAVDSFTPVLSDVSIIGCSGLSIESGITTSVMHEAKVNSKIVERSGQLIIVADYRKIGTSSNFKIGDLNDIDILVTDQYADKGTLDQMEQRGIKVIQVFV